MADINCDGCLNRFLLRGSTPHRWKVGVSLLVAALVTLVAAVHYFYMREVWVTTGESPTVYRYIDWLITVPLQMVEFYLILFAVGAATSRIFWHLLVGTLVMLLGGYFGEIGAVDATLGFIVGMVGWVYILYFILPAKLVKKLLPQAEP